MTPDSLKPRTLTAPITIGLLAIAALTASSHVSVPMYPAPMTLQTLAVLLVGALLGPRAGAAAVLSWLALAMCGAPVLAGGKAGLAVFAGPTAGYLAAFPVAAALSGLLVQRVPGIALRLAGFIGLHGFILMAGALWLSVLVGIEAAIAGGVTPFLLGAILKSGLATAGLVALRPALK